MIGEVVLFGVFVPTFLVIGIWAIILCGLLSNFLSAVGFYRLVAFRPLVDLSIFALLFAALCDCNGYLGHLS